MPFAMRNNALQLTSVQQDIWFDQLLQDDIPLYNIGGYIQIDGPINREIFQAAIRHVVNVNEAFQTVFHMAEAIPKQSFQKKLNYHLPFLDMSHFNQPEHFAISWMKQAFNKVFQLNLPPFFEFALIKISNEKYFWFIKMHHLIADGWSISFCTQSVANAYCNLSQGHQLNKNAFLYQDFIDDDQVFINSDQYQQNISYWKSVFKTFPKRLVEHKNQKNTLRTELYTFSIDHSFYHQITDVAKSMGQTTFRFFVAALYIYFLRVTGNEELVIGVPILNRQSHNFKQTMGLFVGVIPARFSFGLDLTLHSLITSIQKVFRVHFNHHRLPISAIKRSIGHYQQKPLFDIELSFEKHNYAVDFNGSKGRAHTLLSDYHAQPLTVFVREFHENADVSIDICYQTSFFNCQDMDRFKNHLLMLLKEMCRFPDKHISQFNFLSEWEKNQIIYKWNQTQQQYPNTLCIHQMLDKQAQQTPEKIAIVYEHNSLSFHELKIMTDKIAWKLQQMGIKPETCVGLFTERSLEMIVGIWSILKAGGAYVPIDPNVHDNRIDHIIKDSGITIVLTLSHLTDRLPSQKISHICLDLISWQGADPVCEPIEMNTPEHMAYVMYTSGTTGHPKGVVIVHSALMNLYFGLNDKLFRHLKEPCRVALNGPLSFDTSVKQIIQVAGGHCLYIIPESIRLHPVQLNRFLKKNHIDVLDCTPSQLNVFLEEIPIEQFDYSLTVLIGGEAIKPDLWQQLKIITKWKFYNLYGPTECTVDSTFCLINDTFSEPVIGIPLPNIQAYILDNHMKPLPIGAVGELYIGGKNLAREYLNKPDLTAKKFLYTCIDQLSIRLFKTGDMAKYQADGNIVYMGRNDHHQVKIHGIKFSLTEIEKRLALHASVKDCVVNIHNEHLFAYVVFDDNSSDSIEWSVMEHLKKMLGTHIIPVSIIRINQIPLTQNGKIDRKALIRIESQKPQHLSTYIAPKTPLESTVASIWAEILHYQPVSMKDHFLKCGGTSLSIMRMAARLYQQLSVEITIKDIFNHLELDSLCRFIAQLPQSPFAPIRSIPFQKESPASDAQNRIWLLDQLDHKHTVYHISGAYHIKGKLDDKALTQTFEFLIKRHESLRTGFKLVDGRLKQVVSSSVHFKINCFDFRACVNATDKALTQIKELFQKPFDLSIPPLLRVYLFHIKDNFFILALNIHHIISDGWSLRILIDEFSICHESFTCNKLPELKEIQIQYRDYVHWKNNLLNSTYGETLKQYWHKELSGELKRIDFPTDYSRPKHLSYAAKYLEFTMDESHMKKLNDICHHQKVSLFSVVTALINILIYKYTGETDIILGTPVAGRVHADLDHLMGCFLNTVVLRNKLHSDQSFLEFVDQVGKKVISSISNQLYPFDRLVSERITERSPDRHPFFDIMISEVLVDEHTHVHLKDISVSPLPRLNPVSPFDLVFSVISQGNKTRLGILYRKQLFKENSIHRMWEHLQILIHQICAFPGLCIHQMKILTHEEQCFLDQLNETQVSYPDHQTFDQLFMTQAESTPHGLAVIDSTGNITYSQLNEKSNKLACFLRKAGVKPGTIVGLSLNRSIEWIIGMMAILKAGAVYLPLDPSYPVNRLHFMLSDTDTRFLLTHKQLIDKFLSYQHKVMYIDASEKYSESYTHISGMNRSKQNTAYIIYTSGSTGNPKGIGIKHNGLCNLVFAEQKRFHLSTKSRVLQFSSISFDASIMEVSMALGSGGCLVIVDDTDRIPGQALTHFINTNQITHLMLPPSLLGYFPDTTLPSVKVIIVGGEYCPIAIAQKWSKNRIFINAYGPSEATVFVATAAFNHEMDRLPIGKPIENTKLYVLDQDLQPTPVGVTGELHISGVGLTDGYINRPELTAKQFIRNPFSKNHQDFLYKTGDYVRVLSNGNIEFIGRMDQQIKIRGIRIELKEIESILYNDEDIHECFVHVSGETAHDKKIIAYVVFKTNIQINETRLMTHLKDCLPSYMIPSHIIPMPEMPKTPGGKLDINALPHPKTVKRAKKYVPPQTELEKKLVDIWETNFQQQIGITDDFFELGGHSIKALQVIQAINKCFTIQLSVATLYTHTTIQELSFLIQVNERKTSYEKSETQNNKSVNVSKSSLVPLQTKGNHNPIFCVHPIEGYVFCYKALSLFLGNNYPLYAFQSDGIATGTDVCDDIPAMASTYIQLMKNVQASGVYTIAGWSFGGVVAFEMACQIQQSGDHTKLVVIDAPVPGTDIELSEEYINAYFPTLDINRNQLSQIVKAHLSALKNYNPQYIYHDELVYVYSRNSSFEKDIVIQQWQHMGLSGAKIIGIHANHNDLLKKPFVDTIGHLLIG